MGFLWGSDESHDSPQKNAHTHNFTNKFYEFHRPGSQVKNSHFK